MGRHAELLDAARDIRQGIADLKSRNETPEGLTHRRSLERRQSISQAERHMFDFDRIMRVSLLVSNTVEELAACCSCRLMACLLVASHKQAVLLFQRKNWGELTFSRMSCIASGAARTKLCTP